MAVATESRTRIKSTSSLSSRTVVKKPNHIPPGSTPLDNPRWETFVRSITGGASATESLICAGYSETGAAGAANRLLKNVKVATRLQFLNTEVARSSVQRAVLTRDWVIENLKAVAVRCMETEDFRPQAATNALVALGKEIGMFREQHDHKVTWDGNMASLTTQQLTVMLVTLPQTAFADDPEGLEAWRRENAGLLDAPADSSPVIEAKSDPIPE